MKNLNYKIQSNCDKQLLTCSKPLFKTISGSASLKKNKFFFFFNSLSFPVYTKTMEDPAFTEKDKDLFFFENYGNIGENFSTNSENSQERSTIGQSFHFQDSFLKKLYKKLN